MSNKTNLSQDVAAVEEPVAGGSGKNLSKIGLFGLIGLVIGSMIGSGVFDLPRNMAEGAGGLAIIVAWVITAIGMVALGLAFQNLSTKRPELDGGVFSYAKEGFGEYWGFNSAFGYWLSAFLGNIAYAVVLFQTIGYFFPSFLQSSGELTIWGILGASVLLWVVHFLCIKGVKQATFINAIVTVAKMVPLLFFVVVIILFFKADIFSSNFLGGMTSFTWSGLMTQVKSTMMVTVWVFIGIEGAVVFSSRAKQKSDVGKATILGLLSVAGLYMVVTLVSMGVMGQDKLAALNAPAMGYMLEALIGKVGATIINIGLIISVLGAWLGWTLLATEVPYLAADQGLFPKFFGKLNKHEAPAGALWLTNIIVQIFLILTYFAASAYTFAFALASAAILVPYGFSAFYQLKYSWKQMGASDRAKNIAIGVISSIYALWLLYAAGWDYLALTFSLYGIGLIIWFWVRKENNKPAFNKTYEVVSAVIIVLILIATVVMIAKGAGALGGLNIPAIKPWEM